MGILNRKIFIYGTGMYSEQLVSSLEKLQIQISGFLDSDTGKHGKTFKGYEIWSLEKLQQTNQNYYIIVGSTFYKEIAEILLERNLIEYQDFCSGDFFFTKYHERISYSQFGEDLLIQDVLRKIKLETAGFYIDVGAYHPHKYSNTYKLYLDGWQGINIEPTPNKIDLFNLIRNRDINLNIGISNEFEMKNFYIYSENAYNTLNEEVVREREQKLGLYCKQVAPIEFYPLEQVIEKYVEKDVHFLNIDVEGHELEVLNSINWDYKIPWIIAVEVYDLEKSRVNRFLIDKGYKLMAKSISTAIYISEKKYKREI